MMSFSEPSKSRLPPASRSRARICVDMKNMSVPHSSSILPSVARRAPVT